jgi:hypothetical protein
MYSLRQMAVYHKEESDSNLATWLLINPPPSVLLSFSEKVEIESAGHRYSPFKVHLLLLGFAVSSWRPYLVHLTQEVHQHVSPLILTHRQS